MTLRDIDIEPECTRIVLRWILRHDAVFFFIDVCDEFDLGLEFENFHHDNGRKRKIYAARGVTIHVVLFE